MASKVITGYLGKLFENPKKTTNQGDSSSDLEKKQISFEKARYDYSIKMFENEDSRKQQLETKAQFYLTFVTAFLSAIFLSLPYLTVLQSFIHNNGVTDFLKTAITVFICALGMALLFSLISILLSMRIQNYNTAYPKFPYHTLFSPQAYEYEEGNEAEFLKLTAKEAIRALLVSRKENDKKARYVQAASFGVLFAVLMLTVLVGIAVYLQVYIVIPSLTKP